MRLRCVIVAFVLCSACEGVSDTPESLLETSFAQQVAGVNAVEQFERVAKELTFAHPNADGEIIHWQVVIDSVAVHPGGADVEPERGDVGSSWYADGVLIEPIGSMSRLPAAFLQSGVAQQCYALWDSEVGAWGW